MPSAAFIATTGREVVDFVVIYLVTITAGATVIRICTDAVDMVSRGETFIACGDRLEVVPYDERTDAPPRGRLRVHNLTGETMRALRSLDPRVDATALIEVVTNEEPDVVQLSWSDAVIRGVPHDPLTLDMELVTDNVAGTSTPALSFDPAHFPALHARGSTL